MQRMLFHTFWLLCVSGLTLVEFASVLIDGEYRATLLMALPAEHELWRYWGREFPSQDRLITEWTQSSLNKVGPLVVDPDLKLVLGQQRSTIDFGCHILHDCYYLLNRSDNCPADGNGHH